MRGPNGIGRAGRPSVHSGALVVALVVALVASSAPAAAAPQRAVGEGPAAERIAEGRDSPLKAVVIVGPAHWATQRYLARGRAFAELAESYGMRVERVFHPYATWPRARAALQGANLVMYWGHGNGWPSPYGPFQEQTKNGFGLNAEAGGSSSDVRYIGGDIIREQVRLARDSVVLFNNTCYAEGNAEPGMAIPSWRVAHARVDNYASAFLDVGARAMFAYGWQPIGSVLTDLMTSDKTMDEIFTTRGARPEAYYGFIGRDDRYLASDRVPGMVNHLDPDPQDGFLRALSGDMRMTAAEFRGESGDDEDPVLDGLRGGSGTSRTVALRAGGSDVPRAFFTPNGDGLGDRLRLRWRLSEAASIEHVVRDDRGRVVRRFSVRRARGSGTSYWDGRDGAGRYVDDGLYVLTLRPRDRAGNRGTPRRLAVLVLTAIHGLTAEPALFHARDRDALARTAVMSFRLDERARVSWHVEDRGGRRVRSRYRDALLGPGLRTWSWDGRDDEGRLAAEGHYTAVVTAATAAGAYRQRIAIHNAAFRVDASDWTPSAGERVRVVMRSAEPLRASPVLRVSQPGGRSEQVRAERTAAGTYRAVVEVRRGIDDGRVRIEVTAVDTKGGRQSTEARLFVH